LSIHARRLAGVDPEEAVVEAPDIIDEIAVEFGLVSLVVLALGGSKAVVYVESVLAEWTVRVLARGEQLPQLFEIVRPREPARGTNDSNGICRQFGCVVLVRGPWTFGRARDARDERMRGGLG
jgi:hypothetical protein